jgi:hypothetical protein
VPQRNPLLTQHPTSLHTHAVRYILWLGVPSILAARAGRLEG